MITEITRAIIAVIIVIAAVLGIIFYPDSSVILSSLLGVIVGYYFKSYEMQAIAGVKNVLGIGKKTE
jgi:small-conductance mechanosensitive channel